MKTYRFVVLFLLAFHTTLAVADDQRQDERGAVLCIWMIHSSMLHIGETCSATTDDDFLDVLRVSVIRIEDFIVRNSDMTLVQLAEERRKRDSQAPSNLCDPAGESMRLYAQVKERVTIGEMRAQIDKLLEVDRPPVSNPCL